MDSFLFSLNATLPIFLVILLGWFLGKIGLLNDAFNKTANTYVFQCALPVSLFLSIAEMDFYSDFDLGFCLFCFVGTAVMFLAAWGIAWLFVRDRGQVGAFAQASARSSAAILGIALAVSIYGEAGMVPMMIVSAVPLFNVFSVMILCFSPQIDENGNPLPRQQGASAVAAACLDVIKNPLILGILIGLPFPLLRLSLPPIIGSALKSVGGTASPIALLVVGATLSGSQTKIRWKTALGATMVKLLLLPGIFLPVGALLGFRNSALVAILIMAGSPTTVAAFVMAKNMHADSTLTSGVIILATLLSSATITFWLFVLRSFGLI